MCRALGIRFLKRDSGPFKKSLVAFLSSKLFSFSRRNYLLALSLISVTVAIAALLLTLGVMNGFIKALEEGISVMTPDIFVIRRGSGIGDEVDYLQSKIRKIPGVEAVSPYVEGQCIVGFRGRFEGIQVRGIDPGSYPKISKVRFIAGSLSLKKGEAVLGDDLAFSLGVAPGDRIYVFSLGLGGKPKVEVLKVAGIYDSGFWVYDKLWIFTDLDTARSMLGTKEFTGLAVFTRHPEKVASSISRVLPPEVFRVTTWFQLNMTLFAALKMEKLAMFIVVAIMVLVSSFSISSLVYVTSLSKVRDIAIMRTFGLSSGTVKSIFFRFGLKVGLLGYAAGVAVALILSFIANRFELIKVPSDVYFVEFIPVIFRVQDFLWVLALSIFLSAVFSLYPASKASRIDPVEVLREV